MILDKVFQGVLDQGAGCLVIFDEVEEDVRCKRKFTQQTYESTLGALKQIGNVVDSLYQKVRPPLPPRSHRRTSSHSCHVVPRA